MASSASKSRRRKRGGRALRLIEVLRALPERELQSLVKRLRIEVDLAKKIDAPSQVARVLVGLSELWTGELPGPTRELLHRIAEEGGVLVVDSLPAALEPLVARGVVYARGTAGGIELILPIAILLQLDTWDGEDPRGMRSLLSQASAEVQQSIASHFLGRTATAPLCLGLEAAWEVLSDPEQLQRGVESLAPLERKLLQAIERVGGEVDTEELLELEREPLRLRGATGATPSRRGVGFALERRAFLIPIHPNRHVIPSEVARLVGAQRREEREQLRQDIRARVLAEDHAPRRARFAEDPVPLVLAMAIAVRDGTVELRPNVGTPRSLINKYSTRFGREPEVVSLLAALSRATGLWDPSVVNTTSPPGALAVQDVGQLLFDAWQRGGAWDEARPDPEVLRAPKESREASAVGVFREMVLEALHELGEGRWVPWEAVTAFVRADSRTPGVARLMERWAGRAGFEPLSTEEITRRVSLDSLHQLGVVDLGDVDTDELSLRLTPRGRAFLSNAEMAKGAGASRFLDNHALRIGPNTLVGHAIGIAPFVEIGRVSGHLDVTVTPAALAQALSAGFETDVMSARLSAVAPLPDPIARLIKQASAVLGRAEFVPSAGFLWVDDPEVRELLATRRSTTDLFVDPSPTGGLLIAAGVELERLASRCRALGVEIVVDGNVYRTRSTAPPRRASSGAMRLDPALIKSTRKSSGSMKAVGRKSSSSSTLKAQRKTSGAKTPGTMQAVRPDDGSGSGSAKSGTRRARRTRSSGSLPASKRSGSK